ncbi:hypothetical protein [uncultured Chitinophaga sp.]|jgi:hypothetical protein|uniref:hypothetical protein n=1 Tax=uncultured Chitinophaga sp. TaxID=339340 RepID=UPI0026138A55|nr:hypothetical protein [uncultured Chitinophaga sp.]
MAKLEKDFEFKGKSVYRMKGSDELIVRKKGGPKPEQVLTSPRFERTRENAKEFQGVQKAVSAIRFPLITIKHLADHNFTLTLTSICKKIQAMDTAGKRGQRSIFLSQQRFMLKNFWLNKRHPFPAIVAGAVNCTLHRETKSGVIQLPMLIPGVNLHLPWKQPLYRFSLSLGLISDVVYENGEYIDNQFDNRAISAHDTAWHVAADPFPAAKLELPLNMPDDLKDSQTLVLAIGIEMGTPDASGEITTTKYAGSACIFALG